MMMTTVVVVMVPTQVIKLTTDILYMKENNHTPVD